MTRQPEKTNTELYMRLGTVGSVGVSKNIMSRIADSASLCFCVSCKEVMLQGSIVHHMCSSTASTAATELTAAFFDTKCAVEDAETKKRCTRGLNCKSHTINMRRAVQNRSAPFDELLKKATEEKRKRKMQKDEIKAEKREKITDEHEKLEAYICSKVQSHMPVMEKTFCMPSVKFDMLAIRSMFFQALKIQRMIQEKKEHRRDSYNG